MANSGNLDRCVKDRMGYLAGHHVDFVRFGHRNQQFGIARTGAGQDIRIRGDTDNAMHIHLFGQTLDFLS